MQIITTAPVDWLELSRILTYSISAFFIGMWLAPFLIQLLVWLKFWKKTRRKVSATGEELTVTKKFYQENEEKKKVPRGGGILIWFVTLSIAIFFWFVFKIEPANEVSLFLNFISRSETFIPVGTLIFGSFFGLVDDALVTMEDGGNYMAGGLKLSHRAILVIILSIAIGLWFHFKVELHTFHIFNWVVDLNQIILFGYQSGWLIIPITTFILLGSWGTGIIDGFDGLAAGVLIPVFICFAGLAFFTRGLYDVATFLMVIVGSTTAYLWFNLPPAKFYLSDTGSVGLLLTLGVTAILLDYIYLLPIAGIMLFLTLVSAVIQVFSKKVFKRKVFLAAPLHHHFEALGYDRNQITFSYWAITIVFSIIAFWIGIYN